MLKRLSITTLLVANCSIGAMDFTTDLHIAAKYGDVKTANYEILHETDVNAIDYDENTPLHWAATYNQLQILCLLLAHPCIRVNAKNVWGETPLHIAAMKGSKEIVTELLKKEETDARITEKDGKTPWQVALENQHKEIAFLIKERADGQSPQSTLKLSHFISSSN